MGDSAKLLKQLQSKEVDDVSAQLPQSMEEMRKALEDQQKENQALRKENEEQARRIMELEALLADKKA